jgi:hypothetical protein
VPAQSSIFYLRAELGVGGRFSPAYLGAREVRLVEHFYVQAEQDIHAGAIAHDICRLQGLEFKEYISLPSLIGEEMIREYEPEHEEAFQVACREGRAVIVSIVLAP